MYTATKTGREDISISLMRSRKNFCSGWVKRLLGVLKDTRQLILTSLAGSLTFYRLIDPLITHVSLKLSKKEGLPVVRQKLKKKLGAALSILKEEAKFTTSDVASKMSFALSQKITDNMIKNHLKDYTHHLNVVEKRDLLAKT